MNEAFLEEFGLKGSLLPLGGGDVNQTYRLTDNGTISFLKTHPGVKQSFFAAEAAGLQALAPYVRVPQVQSLGESPWGAFLQLEWIEQGSGDHRDIGRGLAYLHQQTQSTFGLEVDNYIGFLPQVNSQTTDWVQFYTICRLDVQVELAKLGNCWNHERETAYLRLKEWISANWQERRIVPSLLHGDFWRGNVLFDQQGTPVFLDPAISYGDREMDIAMSQLFGGFQDQFLAAYQEVFPLESGWQERLPIYQLYYLLVHLNQFGESYGPNVDEILNRF